MRKFILLAVAALFILACEKDLTPIAPEKPAPQTNASLADPHEGHEKHDHDHDPLFASIPEPSGEKGVIDVYSSPSCGCCGKWIEHLRAHGLKVNDHKVETPIPVKAKYGLPRELMSCHTGIVEGYLVEGHVPASVVKRLLKERPDVKGIAVPRMPEGSPGMEGPNPVPYDVYAYTADGSSSVYEHIPVQ